MKKNNFSISFHSSKIIRILVIVFIVLIIANFAALYLRFILGHDYVYGFVLAFDVNKETNIPTCFSAFILLLSACLLWLIAIFKKSNHDSYFIHWFIFSIIFFYISIDEAARIHEFFNKPLSNVFHFSGMYYFSWVIIGLIIIVLFRIFYLKFLDSLPTKTRKQFIFSLLIYIWGAIGVDMVGEYYSSLHGENIIYNMIGSLEESLEMIGVIIFIDALLKYIKINISDIKLSFK